MLSRDCRRSYLLIRGTAFYLFSEKLIAMHQEKYNFLHLGMIQVSLKPATGLGLNNSAILCVCDKRHNKFHDSLMRSF